MVVCNLCGGSNLLPLINFGDHPISHHYLGKAQQDDYINTIELRFCEDCGLTQIIDPIPPEKFYTELFAVSSWKNQPHIQHEIKLLSNLSGISEDSFIVEIASNDGTFCKALLDAGYTRCIGIEPAQDARKKALERGVETIGAYFTIETARNFVQKYGQADLIVARHVLEHIPDLREVQEAINLILAPGGYLFLEVPDFSCNLLQHDYGIWEEHVNQFTIDTLREFTNGINLLVHHVEKFIYSGQSIILIGSKEEEPAQNNKEYLPALRQANIRYIEKWSFFKNDLINYLEAYKKKGGKIAIYGAGGRACALVNYTGIGPYIDCFIDDQLEKQGLIMPGSYLSILPNSTLYSEGITLCLLAVNTENESRVLEKHKGWIDNGGEFFSILPPSNRLLPVWDNYYLPINLIG